MKIARQALLPLLICMAFIWIALPVSADMGPKPELTVYVQNPPEELYYLDLLTKNGRAYDNFINTPKEEYNAGMLALLYSYQEEGWLPAFTEGTGIPLFGDLIGVPDGDTMVHTFIYHGVPRTYRIIIVTESGKVTVTDAQKRSTLQSSVTLDYQTGETRIPQVGLLYFLQFLSTLIPTFLIEGILLLLFRFSLRGNWKVFLLTNLLTQVLLTASLGAILITQGPVSVYFLFLPIEAVILIVETVVYRFKLSGRSTGRRIAYAIVANFASCAAGILLAGRQFEALMRLA